AIQALRRYAALSGDDPDALMRLGCACAQSGDVASTRDVLDSLQARSRRSYVSPVNLAALELALGSAERALDRLDVALEEHAASVPMLGVDPAFAPLRRDARFQALLRRIGFAAAPAPPRLQRR